MSTEYDSFLASKAMVVPAAGMTTLPEMGAHLFAWQADIVKWALRRGRACVFSDCGTGKGPMALEWAHAVAASTGRPVIILAPLAVAQQFEREGAKFGRSVVYLRDGAEYDGQPVIVTNYDRLAKFDATMFGGVVLDESSIIKHHDAKTRAAVIETFRDTPFKLACTATPAPNDHVELGNHAEFMGVCTMAEMLATYFVHDGGDTQSWRLKGHATDAFWRWVCSWAVMIRKPSDLGYDDGAFVLPALRMHQVVVPVDHEDARTAGMLFAMEARSLAERRDARRTSLAARVAKAAEIVAREPDTQWLLWCNLNDEGDALTAAIPGAVQVAGSDTDDHKLKSLVDFAAGSLRVVVSKPKIAGHGMNLQSCARMVFVGLSDSFEQFYQAVRRCYRFGQTRDVDCYVVTSELEGAVVANVERKERDALAMATAMVERMRDAMQVEIRGATRETIDYRPGVAMTLPTWLMEAA